MNEQETKVIIVTPRTLKKQEENTQQLDEPKHFKDFLTVELAEI